MIERLETQDFGYVRGILEPVPLMADNLINTIMTPEDIAHLGKLLLFSGYVLKSDRQENYPDELSSRHIADQAFGVLCPLGTLHGVPEVSNALSETLLFYNRESPILPNALDLHERATRAYAKLVDSSIGLKEIEGTKFSRVKTPGAILRSQIEHPEREVFDIVGWTIVNPDFRNSSELNRTISGFSSLFAQRTSYSHTKINNFPHLILGLDNVEHVTKEDGYQGVHVYFRYNADSDITIQVKFLSEPHKPDSAYLRYKFQ